MTEILSISDKPLASLALDLVILDECCDKHPEVKLVSHKKRLGSKACKKCVEESKINRIMKLGGLPDWTIRDKVTGEIVRYEPHTEDKDGEVIAQGEFKQTTTALEKVIDKFKLQRNYDLSRSGVVEFAYTKESLEKLEAFEKWLIEKFRDNLKHVEIIMVSNYLSLVKNAYMSKENQQRLIDKKGSIERAELVIVDNLGDYSPEEQTNFLSLMRLLQNKRFILLTFADADGRLDRLPAAVKFAIQGNRMVIL